MNKYGKALILYLVRDEFLHFSLVGSRQSTVSKIANCRLKIADFKNVWFYSVCS